MTQEEVALYVRVSEGRQHPENQIKELLNDIKEKKRTLYKHKCKNIADFDRQTAKIISSIQDQKQKAEKEAQIKILHSYIQQGIFIDFGQSGRNAQRAELLELLELAHQRQFNMVEVWALDRFTREGTKKLFHYLSVLDKNKVGFISFKEPFISTLGPFKDVILALLGALAEMESIRQGERVKSGIGRVIAAGGSWGVKHQFSEEAGLDILALRKLGLGYLAISRIIKERHGKEIKPASIRYFSKHYQTEKGELKPTKCP